MAEYGGHINLLCGKRAVIFGAGGSVGAGVAAEFADQGARVLLSGRALGSVKELEQQICRSGGEAQAVQVDALDEAAVDQYLEGVVDEHGGIDVVLNLTGPQAKDYGNGTSALALPLEQYVLPLNTLVVSQFITARAAARHMVRQHQGVILFLTAVPAVRGPGTSAIGSAFGAMESLLRCLTAELGPEGVRVVGIRSGPMLETRTIQQSFENLAHHLAVDKEQIVAMQEQAAPLRSSPTVADTARLAAFLASDWARALTGVIVNGSSGRVTD
jgi:NAD(P)-dependent dehydrogenase (short-subunit alcohol dehydrogenase family)